MLLPTEPAPCESMVPTDLPAARWKAFLWSRSLRAGLPRPAAARRSGLSGRTSCGTGRPPRSPLRTPQPTARFAGGALTAGRDAGPLTAGCQVALAAAGMPSAGARHWFHVDALVRAGIPVRGRSGAPTTPPGFAAPARAVGLGLCGRTRSGRDTRRRPSRFSFHGRLGAGTRGRSRSPLGPGCPVQALRPSSCSGGRGVGPPRRIAATSWPVRPSLRACRLPSPGLSLGSTVKTRGCPDVPRGTVGLPQGAFGGVPSPGANVESTVGLGPTEDRDSHAVSSQPGRGSPSSGPGLRRASGERHRRSARSRRALRRPGRRRRRPPRSRRGPRTNGRPPTGTTTAARGFGRVPPPGLRLPQPVSHPRPTMVRRRKAVRRAEPSSSVAR